MSYRGEFWSSLIQNSLKINPAVFEAFKDDYTFGRNSKPIQNEQTHRFTTRGSKRIIKEDSLILKDIPRTFPHLNELFEEVHHLTESLVCILGAFQNYRPDCGYVQGMCYLAAMLLIHQTRPEDCYVTFCNLVVSSKFHLIYDFYTAKHQTVLATYKVFWKLLRNHCPNLYINMKDNDATCKFFLFEWIITLFSNSFDI